MKKNTSWGKVAGWYDALLSKEQGTYQHDVILPNMLRLLAPKQKMKILDLACGQGFFSHAFAREGADVVGIDISPELIELGKLETGNCPPDSLRDSKRAGKLGFGTVNFFVGSADHIPQIPDGSMDAVTIILSIQNIENMAGVFSECARVLRSPLLPEEGTMPTSQSTGRGGGSNDGRMLLVMNHPAFRVPKSSGWGWDEAGQIEYRRIDQYLSESRVKIDTHPGLSAAAGAKADDDPLVHTWTFHRPLQVYMKALAKAGFGVTRLEEWISNREPPRGKVFIARNRARKEIPLFLFLEARPFLH